MVTAFAILAMFMVYLNVCIAYLVFCMMYLKFCLSFWYLLLFGILYGVFSILYGVFGIWNAVFGILYGVFGIVREKLDPCSIWGFPEAASSLLGLTDEMARKVFCHFHFHFLHIIESGRDADFTPVLVEDVDADNYGGCEDDESGVGIKMAIPPSELGHVPRISRQQTNRHSTCTPPLPPPLPVPPHPTPPPTHTHTNTHQL